MSTNRPAVLLVGGRPERAATAVAAALAIDAARSVRPEVLLADAAGESGRRGPTMLASPAGRALESALRSRGLPASARGHFCHVSVEPNASALAELGTLAAAAPAGIVVLRLPAPLWLPALESRELSPRGALMVCDLPAERPMAALAHAEARSRGVRMCVCSERPSAIAARRALAGVRPGGALSHRMTRFVRRLAGESGQALPAVVGAAVLVLIAALALAAIGGAITGAGRVQRAADLAALSAARSMRDDMPRLLAPPLLPGGGANPAHLTRAAYLGRAGESAERAARLNGVDPARIRLSFPDRRSTPPLRVRVRVLAEIDPGSLPGGDRATEGGRSDPIEVEAAAVAEATPPEGTWTGLQTRASGGGYSGPLTYRNGEGMRPDVARAFDRMEAAARGAGHGLVVNSGFRSDAEQARLFAAHPDPRWVAPPGRSLHRCATDLDLGPSSAYGWLAANARRFGFLRRYSWEPWHYGFVAGPPPCSAAGNSGGIAGAGGGGADPDGTGSAAGLPSFVPARYRAPILRSAARWNVSAAMLAAQLMAESGFDPRAVSPAGAQGIAQFIPSTAASYGLRSPFDPEAAIDAQAHLMSDLLRRFRSVPLALAAYNAGPGAVAACGCPDPYAETASYVARILALLDGAGAALVPPLEVRLVK